MGENRQKEINVICIGKDSLHQPRLQAEYGLVSLTFFLEIPDISEVNNIC